MRELQGFEHQGWKRLEILEAATSLNDLRGLPSNRLEMLRGDRAGQYSIRVNAQWRLCFDWLPDASGPSNVEIVDYHRQENVMTRPAIHPGEILADELEEAGLKASELCRQIKVPVSRMTRILKGKQAITGDTALRLGHWFGNSGQFWLNLQTAYDLRRAEEVAGQEIAALPVRSTDTSRPRQTIDELYGSR